MHDKQKRCWQTYMAEAKLGPVVQIIVTLTKPWGFVKSFGTQKINCNNIFCWKNCEENFLKDWQCFSVKYVQIFNVSLSEIGQNQNFRFSISKEQWWRSLAFSKPKKWFSFVCESNTSFSMTSWKCVGLAFLCKINSARQYKFSSICFALRKDIEINSIPKRRPEAFKMCYHFFKIVSHFELI